MQKYKRILSLLLTFAILFTAFSVSLQVSAVTYPMYGTITSNNGVANIYSIAGYDGDELNPEDKFKSEKLCELTNGTQVKVLGVETDAAGDKWYKINYGDNYENTGYAILTRVTLKYEYVYDEDFEKNLANFPASYHDGLRAIKAQLKNAKFIKVPHTMTLDEAVNVQYGSKLRSNKKVVEFTYGGEAWRDIRGFNKDTGGWENYDAKGRYTYASYGGIKYFMDPRTYLNNQQVGAFLSFDYNENCVYDKEVLRDVVSGTFLAKGYDDNTDAYLEDILYAAKESLVSPYAIAAIIIVEQGTNGTSELISGTVAGYESYYNFFNVGASDLGEGAVINGLKRAEEEGWRNRRAAIEGGAKFFKSSYVDVGQNTFYYTDFNVEKNGSHQYATALYDAYNKASRFKVAFTNHTESDLVFYIPVFEETSSSATEPPTVIEKPENEPVIIKGDTNQDGSINAIDLAAIKMHILGVKSVEGNAAKAADVNSDEAINAIDLAAVKMHILGVKTIS